MKNDLVCQLNIHEASWLDVSIAGIDLGIHHVYIKPRTPRLNGKVERSHGTDEVEFYQLLTYTDDVDLNEKLTTWEKYYNLHRPHGGLKGHAPYEILQMHLRC